MYLQTMSDLELLAMLQLLGETDESGSITPHHVTMLQEPRPSEAQLNGLAEIAALVSTAVHAGLPSEGDGTRVLEGQIILHSCAKMSQNVSTVTAAVTNLERWRRRVDDDGKDAQGQPVTGTHFTPGLGSIGKQGGHPIPLTTLHWHLDTSDRIPARIRTLAALQVAQNTAGRAGEAKQTSRAERTGPAEKRAKVTHAKPAPGSLTMQPRPVRLPALASRFFPGQDHIPVPTWKAVYRLASGFPNYSPLTSQFKESWASVKAGCVDHSFPSPSTWIQDLMASIGADAVTLPARTYPAAIVAKAPALLNCLSCIHASQGHAAAHATYLWAESEGAPLVLIGLSRHLRTTREVGNNWFGTTPSLSPIVPLAPPRNMEAAYPIRWQWWRPGPGGHPSIHVLSVVDKAVSVHTDAADKDAVALGVVGILDQSHMFNSRSLPQRIDRLFLNHWEIATASQSLQPAQRLLLVWSTPIFRLCFCYVLFFDNIDDLMLCAWVPSDIHATPPTSQADGGILFTMDGLCPFTPVGVFQGDTEANSSSFVPDAGDNPQLIWATPFLNALSLIDALLVTR